MKRNLSIKPVRDLQKSMENAHALVEKQEARIVSEIFKFVQLYTAEQVKDWLAAEEITTTKKANDYTGVTKMAFAKLGDDNVSDQRLSFYSTVCLALEAVKIDELTVDAYLADTTLSKIRNDYLDAKREAAANSGERASPFRGPKKLFHDKYKAATLKGDTLQMVVGFTDANGDFISSMVVDDVKKAEKYIKDAVREPKLPANPFKPLLMWFKNLDLDFKKKEDVRIVFTKTATSLTAVLYVANDQRGKKVELDTKFEGLADCIPTGLNELSRLQLIDLRRLSAMVKHGDKAIWAIKNNNIVVTPKNMTVPELLTSIKLSRTNKKANWPDKIDVAQTKLSLSYSDPK